VKAFEVPEVEQSGLDRRPDQWEIRLKIEAGQHEIEAAFPRQFEGLPPKYGGPNPSRRPIPALRDPSTIPLPPNAPPGKIEERRIAIEKFKEQSLHPVFDGLAVMAFNIVGPYAHKKGPSPESVRKIYACGHFNGLHQPGCDRKILSSLAGRAFRRAVTANEVDGFLTIAAGAQRRGGSFEDGIALAIETLLVSPDFSSRFDSETPEPSRESIRTGLPALWFSGAACPMTSFALRAARNASSAASSGSRLPYAKGSRSRALVDNFG
jgi:hypothetical protein